MFEKYSKYFDAFGVRFYRKEKKRFIEELRKDLEVHELKEMRIDAKKWLRKSETYVFGNLKNAKVVFNIPYDTQNKIFWAKSTYYPLDGEATQKKQVLPLTTQIIAVYFVSIFGLLVLTSFINGAASAIIANLSLFFILAFVLKIAYSGFKNKKNYNRNSAAVVLALEILDSLPVEQRHQVAFAFTDSNLASYIGVKSLQNEFVKLNRKPLVLTLNTLALGEVLVGFNDGIKKEAQLLVRNAVDLDAKVLKLNDDQRYLTCGMPFDKSISIAAGAYDKKGRLYALNVNSSNDKKVDFELLEKEKVMILNFLNNYLKK